MAPATNAELFEFKSSWIIPAVLLGRVIPLAAHGALERDHLPIGFALLGHCTTSLLGDGSVNRLDRLVLTTIVCPMTPTW